MASPVAGAGDAASPPAPPAASAEQAARAELRERSLRAWSALEGRPASFALFGGVTADATLLAVDAAQTRFVVADLDSGVGTLRRAELRAPDVASVKFARHLAAECVPEWREAYVDYKRLKKVLSAVRDGIDVDGGSGFASEEGGGGRGASAASSEGSGRSVTAGGVRAMLQRARPRLRQAESAESSPAPAVPPSPSGTRPGTERPRRRGHPRGAEGLIAVRWSAPGRDGAPQTTVAASTVHGETAAFPEEQCFFRALDTEARKVNDFFRRTEEQFASRFDDILAALARHRDAVEAARRAAAAPAAAAGSLLRRRSGKGSAPQLADGEDADVAAANEAANAHTLDVGAFNRLRARGDAFPFPFPRPPAEVPAGPAGPPPLGHRRGLSMEEVGAFVGAHLGLRSEGGAGAQQGLELGRMPSAGTGALARDEDAAERGGSAHGGTQFAFGSPTPGKRARAGGPHLHLPHLHLPSLPLPALPAMHLPGPSAAAAALRDAKQLRRAMVEFYRGLGLLSGFASMNATAITKILKKHDKCTGWATSQVYLPFVDRAHFRTAEHNLEAMRRAIEREFEALEIELAEATHHHAAAEGKAAGSAARRRATHRNALAKLRPPPPHAPSAATLLAAGAACGSALCVLANVLALLKQAYARPAAADHVAALLPVLRGPLLMLAHFAMYGAAVAAWSRVRISYAFIFGAAPGTEMLFAEYLLLSGTLATLWLIAWAGILADLVARTGSAEAAASPDGGVRSAVRATGLVPVLLLAAACLAVAAPLPERVPTWPPRASRWFFAGTVGRMLAAPFFAVKLPDFFMADQLTSQLQGISDLLYTGCYYMSGAYALRPSAAAGVCLNGRGGLSSEVKLALCLVPFWLRILQCGRRLRDERARLHAVNIGKYAAGALALIVRYLRDVRPPSAGWTAASALVSLGSSAYSYAWDLVMDWGLLRPSKMHPGLRDVLMVKEPRLYYFAMGLNALLRLTWIASLVRWPHPGAGHALVLPSVLAYIEVFRRCWWNYFRIENEQVANTGQFRAIAAVPLPGAAKGAKPPKPLPQPPQPQPPAPPGSPAGARRRVSFDDLPAVGRRGRSARGEDEAAALLEDEEAPRASSAAGSEAESEAAPLTMQQRRSSSDWDRTAVALKRVGTMASFLRGEDEAEEERQAPAEAPLDAVSGGSRAAGSPRRERPAGEHFTWEDGDHSDDD